MPKLLAVSRNLLGDGLWAGPALRAWAAANQDWELDLLTNPDQTRVIYDRMGLRVRVVTREEELARPYDREVVLDPGAALSWSERTKGHIAQGYAEMLGVELLADKMPEWCKPVFLCPMAGGRELLDGRVEETPLGVALRAPFSRSCASQCWRTRCRSGASRCSYARWRGAENCWTGGSRRPRWG